MVEQATLNRQVAGSSPVGRISGCRVMVALLIWDQECVGSSPVTPTKKNKGGKVECSRVKHTEN